MSPNVVNKRMLTHGRHHIDDPAARNTMNYISDVTKIARTANAAASGMDGA